MRFILPILFLFFGFNAFSQVDFEKQTNAKNYLSFYSSIATIADTSNIKNGIWDGATVVVEDSGKVFVYNGNSFSEFQQGIQSTPDTSALLVYAPAHGLADTITLYGYVPVKTDYTRATANTLSNVHFAYAVDSPHPDTLELKIAGYLNLGLNHGLTLGELYYLQDNGTQGLTAGTVRAPTVVVLSATEVILLEVGADEDQVIARVPIISPTITAAGGNPIIPTDSIIQVVIETIYKPAGLAKPGTIFFTTFPTQSSNLTYRENTNNPLTPSYSWLWDGKTATRINTLITSINLESTTSGGLTLTPVTAVPPNDSIVTQWLETNYTTNNLRLYNGSILYYEGTGTKQSPQRQWMVIDDLSNGAEANNYKRIIKSNNSNIKIPTSTITFGNSEGEITGDSSFYKVGDAVFLDPPGFGSFFITRYQDRVDANRLIFRKARGTKSEPLAAQVGDYLGAIEFFAATQSGFLNNTRAGLVLPVLDTVFTSPREFTGMRLNFLFDTNEAAPTNITPLAISWRNRVGIGNYPFSSELPNYSLSVLGTFQVEKNGPVIQTDNLGKIVFARYGNDTINGVVSTYAAFDSNGQLIETTRTSNVELLDTTSYTTNQTIRLGEYNLVDVRASAVTFTVPAGATVGQSFTVVDSWGNAGTNPITINLVTNSYRSHGAIGNYTMNVSNSITKWTFINGAVGWIVETK